MKHVVIGGGPSGVIYALKVKKDYPNDKVVIIESCDKLLKTELPKLDVSMSDLKGKTYQEIAYLVMKQFLTDFTEEELKSCIDKAYDNKDAALKIIEKDYASKTLAFLRELGLIYIIDNAGRFYPYSNSSLTVWKVLIEAIKKFNIDEDGKNFLKLTGTINTTGFFFCILDISSFIAIINNAVKKTVIDTPSSLLRFNTA